MIQGDPLLRDDLLVLEHRFVPLDLDLAAQLAGETPVDLLVLDVHPQQVPAGLGRVIGAWRAAGAKVIAIDGLLNLRPELDLIFIPSFQFKPPADLQDGAPIVWGWDCFLLDVPSASAPWQPGRRVLALTGGSDATQLGASWPGLLNRALPHDAELHWVTGPYALKPNWPAAPRIPMFEHVAPAGLAALMRQTHCAVTVFGVSFFELLAWGVPTVVFSPYGDKDAAELGAIAASGVAWVAADEHDATERLVELLEQEELARELSQRARAALGQSGVQRLCSEMAALIAD